MGKRSTRKSAKRLARATTAQMFFDDVNVVEMFDDQQWSPLHTGSQKKNRTRQNDNCEPRYRKNLRPHNPSQERFMRDVEEYSMVMAMGPAGTGKTYVAIAKGVEALEKGSVNRIILSRPAIEAGESLGFLPGDLEEKLSPYLRPLYDALSDRLPSKRLKTLMAENVIEIAPIAYMRGRTLNNAYVVIDEAQNCTYGQLKMLLTRLGWHSTMVITGDPQQSDLLPGLSGLSDIASKLDALSSVSVIKFDEKDVVRHPLVAEMIGVL